MSLKISIDNRRAQLITRNNCNLFAESTFSYSRTVGTPPIGIRVTLDLHENSATFLESDLDRDRERWSSMSHAACETWLWTKEACIQTADFFSFLHSKTLDRLFSPSENREIFQLISQGNLRTSIQQRRLILNTSNSAEIYVAESGQYPGEYKISFRLEEPFANHDFINNENLMYRFGDSWTATANDLRDAAIFFSTIGSRLYKGPNDTSPPPERI